MQAEAAVSCIIDEAKQVYVRSAVADLCNVSTSFDCRCFQGEDDGQVDDSAVEVSSALEGNRDSQALLGVANVHADTVDV